MYRSSVDNTILYTPDDIVLFRESPFAAWMERLTLENPDHGIPPDLDSTPPGDRPERQDDIVATLRAEGRNVAQIDPELEEPERRAATLESMRGGADFIVHGQLTVGALSGNASLLMRTSGYSGLGDFLYIPCETHSRNTLHSAFRLCFLADLLHQVQGQLPPQLLLIRDGAEVVPLQTDEHIHYFRAVLRRFTQAMATFRKHRMPDPAESSHFGRWAECASEVIKQRALSEQRRTEEPAAEPAQEEAIELPQLRVASGAASGGHDGNDSMPRRVAPAFQAGTVAPDAATKNGSSHTLAEQARMLEPGTFRASAPVGHTPNLAGYVRPHSVPPAANARQPGHNRRSSDSALENLEFIGSSPTRMVVDIEPLGRRADSAPLAPAPKLRDTVKPTLQVQVPDADPRPGPTRLPDLEPKAPVFLPPDQVRAVEPPDERLKPQPRINSEANHSGRSVIDLDSAPAPTLAPVVQRAEAEFERLIREDPIFRNAELKRPTLQAEEDLPALSPFSNSLMTSEDFGEN